MNEEQRELGLYPPHTGFVWPICSPWRDLLLETVEQVRQKLLLVSPFLTEDVIAALETVLQKKVEGLVEPIDIRLLTRIRLEDFTSGASSLYALERFLQWPTHYTGWQTEVRVIDNIHAKVWVFDEQLAFVGSGNATYSGLEANIEYGLATQEPQLVTQIIADWQPYWEQAAPITLEDLSPLHTALQLLHTDSILTEIVQKSTRRRDALLEEIKVKSRLGEKIVLPGSRKKRSPITTSRVKEHPSAFVTKEAFSVTEQVPSVLPANTSRNIHLQTQEMPIVIPPKTIFLSQYDLWRAFNWTFPMIERGQASWDGQDAYLRIDWFAISSELQLTRANETQLSRATIRGYIQDKTIENRHITLDRYAIKELADVLQSDGPDSFTHVTKSSLLNYQISLDAWPEHCGISKLQVPVNIYEQVLVAHRMDSWQHIHNIPLLQKPLSHITIQHKNLVEHLRQLEAQWQSHYPGAVFPRVVELHVSLAESEPGILLSIGPLDQRLETFIPGNNCVLIDSSITLRLNTTTLWQVFDSSLHSVDEWHLQIGHDVSALQLLPTKDIQEHLPIWFHQLKNME